MHSKLPAELTGKVTRFKGDGRRLGYPTANLTTDTDLEDGVYFGFSDLAEWKNHPSLIFVGAPATMGDSRRRVEAHLLDIPDRDYYDQQLRVSAEYYHRPNQTFMNVEELQVAMQADETTARQWFDDQKS